MTPPPPPPPPPPPLPLPPLPRPPPPQLSPPPPPQNNNNNNNDSSFPTTTSISGVVNDGMTTTTTTSPSSSWWSLFPSSSSSSILWNRTSVSSNSSSSSISSSRSFSSNSLQMQVLQHQLDILQQKQRQSQSQSYRLLIQDLSTSILWCTINVLTATLVRRIIIIIIHMQQQPPPQTITTYNTNISIPSSGSYCHSSRRLSFVQRLLFGSGTSSTTTTTTTTTRVADQNHDNHNEERSDIRDESNITGTTTIQTPNNGTSVDINTTDSTTTDHRQPPQQQQTGIGASITSTKKLQQQSSTSLPMDTNNTTTPTANETKRKPDIRWPRQPSPQPYKYLEILVHNVSHTDLVLGLHLPTSETDDDPTTEGDNYILNDGETTIDNDASSFNNIVAPVYPSVSSSSSLVSDDHNNSHAAAMDDLLDATTTTTSPYMKNYIRPRFSSFDMYCRLVLGHVLLTTKRSRFTNSLDPDDGNNNIDDVPNNNYVAPETKETSATASVAKDDITTTIIHFPRYQRSMIDPRYSIREFHDHDFTTTNTNATTTKKKKKYVPPKMAPTGIQMSYPIPLLPVMTVSPSSAVRTDHPIEDTIRIRGRDAPMILSALKNDSRHDVSQSKEAVDDGVSIKYVFFPLLATLLPVWYRQIKEKEYQEPVKRVLILVTGVGTPRNYTHSIHGNSTEACADLMKVFLSNVDPTLTVVKVFSDTTNIFRTDENILFCERELIPLINAYRNAHVMGTPYPDDDDHVPILDETSVYFDDDAEADWHTRLHVTLSFADGSPARTQAIQSSLRSYKPTYFHFWQLKTFWHESKIVDDDIEVHSFATMESMPAIDTTQIRDPYMQAIVSEMRAFYDEMITALNNKDNDIDRFWLRKSHKPVLAVLLVQTSSSIPTSKNMDGTTIIQPNFRLHRGTNMEVSMPTGSLCAERNAIGSALAMNPNLKRHDLKMIAVLAVPPLEPTTTLPVDEMVESLDFDRANFMVDTAQNNGTGSNKLAFLGDSSDRISDKIRRITSYSSILEESLDPNDDDSDIDTGEQNLEGISIDDLTKDASYTRKSSIGSDYEPTTTTTSTANAASYPLFTNIGEITTTSIATATSSSFCLPIGSSGDGDGLVPNERELALPKRKATEPIRRIPLFPKGPQITTRPTASLSDKGNQSMSTNTLTNSTLRKQQQQQLLHPNTMKRTVVVQSMKDMNPLSPCGACNEWLKKIAQCNPYFKIITFTDANCNGMYISSCHD